MGQAFSVLPVRHLQIFLSYRIYVSGVKLN